MTSLQRKSALQGGRDEAGGVGGVGRGRGELRRVSYRSTTRTTGSIVLLRECAPHRMRMDLVYMRQLGIPSANS